MRRVVPIVLAATLVAAAVAAAVVKSREEEPNPRSPRVAWVGLGGDVPTVRNLQKRIDRSLVPLGFTPEKREFSPHLTIGRVRDKATLGERTDLGKMIESLRIDRASSFSVDSVSLMRSTLTSTGAIYDQLATVVLDKI